jgi:RAMA domain-containing protein
MTSGTPFRLPREQRGLSERALLIASAAKGGLNSAEIGWLEGRLYDVLNNAVACEVMNGNRPGDDSLPVHQRDVLGRYVEPVMAALRACGASPDTADQKPEPKGMKKVAHYSESVADLLQAGLLKPDTVLHPLKKGVSDTAQVLPDGRLKVGSQLHGSLSAAAKAVTGSVAEAGWDFWGAPSGEGGFVPLAKLRQRLREGNGGSIVSEPADSSADKPDAELPKHEPVSPANARLAELVLSAGLPLPLPLHANYRGHTAEAVLDSSGAIRYAEKRYRSPSLAASAARKVLGYARHGSGGNKRLGVVAIHGRGWHRTAAERPTQHRGRLTPNWRPKASMPGMSQGAGSATQNGAREPRLRSAVVRAPTPRGGRPPIRELETEVMRSIEASPPTPENLADDRRADLLFLACPSPQKGIAGRASVPSHAGLSRRRSWVRRPSLT